MDFTLVKANIKYYDDLLPIIKDEEVMKNIQKGKIWDKEYLLDHLKESQKLWESKKTDMYVWIIVKNGKGIGYLRWKKINNNFKLRIFIDKKFQNKNIGTESIKLSIQKVVKYYKDRYLYAEIHNDNVISEKMLTKVGFKFSEKNDDKNIKIFKYDLFFNVFPTLNLFFKYTKLELFETLKKYKPERIKDINKIYNKNVYKDLSKFNEKNFSKLNNEYVIYKLNYKNEMYLFDLTDLFSEKCRIKCKYSFNKLSPYDYFKTNKNKIIFDLKKNNKEINRDNIRNAIYGPMKDTNDFYHRQLGCTNFKLTFILTILDYFKPKAWLDLSAGWGDRLLGALIYDIDYYCGIDPSDCMNEIYPKMIEKFGPSKQKNYEIIKSGSEDVKLTREFDFIFTSPPFYDFEIYNNEDDQSINKFNTYDKWMKNFMFKSIKNGWDVLKKGCYFALYIQYKSNNKPFFEPINEYITNELKGQFSGSMYFYWDDYQKLRNLYVWQKI